MKIVTISNFVAKTFDNKICWLADLYKRIKCKFTQVLVGTSSDRK